jgi:hypothetical protein
MDADHLRHHLQDLSGRRYFLRTLKPDTERYKLWLGDLVELVNVAYGPGSLEMSELRAILVERPRVAADAAEEERVRDYLERLEAFGRLLERMEQSAAGPRAAGSNGH